MPTRYLKESICTSESLAKLSAEAERFWYRLLVQCDDYGRFDARPRILRPRCFPLMLDDVSESDITRWLNELEQADLIHIYSVQGKPYLHVINFNQHNTPRAKSSKWPSPLEGDGIPADTQADASTCQHLHADAGRRDHAQKDVTYTKTNTNTKTKTKTETDVHRRQIDPEWGKAVKLFENNISLITGSMLPDMLNVWDTLVEKNLTDWWEQAITIAAEMNQRNWRYVRGILTNCLAEGHPPKSDVHRNGNRDKSPPNGKATIKILLDGEVIDQEITTHG